MSDIKIINPIDYPGWDQHVLTSSHHSFFHSSAWAKVLSESYGYRPLYFAYFSNNHLSTLIPLMEIKTTITPLRATSLPFTDYCQPITTHDEQFPSVLTTITNYGKERNWKYLELKGGGNHLPNVPASSTYYTHTLKLSKDEKQIFAGFRKGTKSSIRKSQREGVQVRFDNSMNSTKEFFRLHAETRKKHGVPPQPFTFFKNIHDNIISSNFGLIALASYKEANIAAAIFFHFGSKVIYKYGASDGKYQHLSPNNLILWQAIERYSQNGYTSFCFGRTDLSNEGLRRFKNGWGTEESLLNYYKYCFKNNQFLSGYKNAPSILNSTLSRLPLPFLKLIGILSYKHMG